MKRYRLAYVAADGLGDGVIQAVINQNLAKLGHSVTYYQDLLCQLDPIIDTVDVRPTAMLTEASLADVDWILLDKSSKNFHQIRSTPNLWAKTLVYSMSKSKPIPDIVNQSLKRLCADPLINTFNGKCLRTHRRVGSLANQAAYLFKTQMGLATPAYEVMLNIPQSWVYRRRSKRVLIHPNSSSSLKNWSTKGFIKLAVMLRTHGYEPVFTMSPQESIDWSNNVGSEFPCVTFSSIIDLAKYYYESAILVGNDSGNGHLASMLKLPTVTLVNVRKKHFSWRPAWGHNVLVRPLLSRRLVGSKLWQATISSQRVFKTVVSLLENSPYTAVYGHGASGADIRLEPLDEI